MINEETKRKLRLMNIGEFIEVSEEQERDIQALALSFNERFQMMVDSVYQQKYNEKVKVLSCRATRVQARPSLDALRRRRPVDSCTGHDTYVFPIF